MAFRSPSRPTGGRLDGGRGAAAVVAIEAPRPTRALQPATRPPRGPWRRRLVAALSALTALWLVAQVAVANRSLVQTWPVVAFPMFSEARDSMFHRTLVARTRSGRAVRVDERDFGLTDLQFQNFENLVVTRTGMVRPQASERMADLASAWNRRHPDDPAVSMTLTNSVLALRPDGPPVSSQTVTWSAR